MSTSECPGTVYIASQTDINNTNFSCYDSQVGWPRVYISNGTGNLDFEHFPVGQGVYVQDSPELESLSFPILSTLREFLVIDAPSLTSISLPNLTSSGSSTGNHAINASSFLLEITTAPKLRNMNLGGLTSARSVVLVDTDSVQSAFIGNITAAYNMTLGGCFDFPKLEVVRSLHILNPGLCSYVMSSLTSVEDLRLTSPGFRWFETTFQAINGSLIVESSDSTQPPDFIDGPGDITHFSTVGSHLNVTNNTSVALEFTQLTKVGGNLSVSNNMNCSLAFNQLLSVGAISMENNVDSTLPWFPYLQRADSIYLRGYIDTSPGPNIFPALTIVPGTVSIEAWNNDFNCSRLVEQWRDGTIHHLVCNGTDNATDTTTTIPSAIPTSSPDTSSSTLSPGAWAGIGISVGLVVIALVFGAVWFIRQNERWKMDLLERLEPQPQQDVEPKPPDTSILREVDGTGTIREISDDHLREAGGQAIISERPDNHICELPVPLAELPAISYQERNVQAQDKRYWVGVAR
ncbi:hypothetical protein GGR54DRAFT_612762 [Hypoxylon sp. NC1633]|nr:hypothetical protein GGR54DRAFT_612762 [Hypoxylon sp. NC1633]